MTDSPTRSLRPPSVARLASAVLSLAAIGVSVSLVAQSIPQNAVDSLPAARDPLAAQLVSADAPNNTIVCQGPFLGFVQQETTPRGFGEPALSILGAGAEVSQLASVELLDVFAGTDQRMTGLPQFAVQDANSGFLAGVASTTIDTPFARGYVASSCQQPKSETWIVGGATTTGRQGVLSLANPGSVQTTVDLELFGDSGPISAPSARGILLQPGERRIFTLSGLTPDEASPVIRVLSTGTPVTATLHVSLTRGLQPDGADVVIGQEPATPTRVLPGLWLESEEQLAAISGQEGYDDVFPILRVLSPDADAIVQVTVSRPVTGDITSELRLEAGRVFDVSLDELGQGHASVRVVADHPIVAGIRHSSVSEQKTDIAWLPSAPIIEGLGSVVVPSGQDAVLQVASAGDQPVSLSYVRVAEDGETVLSQGTVSLESGEFTTRDLGSQGGNFLVDADGAVALGVLLRGSGEMANLVVSPPPPLLPEVSVYSR